MSDFDLYTPNEFHETIREAIRPLVRDKIAPAAAEVDATAEFPQAAYDALRGDNPGNVPKDVRLAGKVAPRVGAPDPVYPGQKIGETKTGDPKVSPDHIVPLAELIKLPGFLKLTSDQMFILSQLPLNYQWLSWTANTAKNSGSAARMLPKADRNWAGKQIQLQNETRNQLQDIIKNLVKANGG